MLKSRVGKRFDPAALAVMAHPDDFLESGAISGPYPLPAKQLLQLLQPLDCSKDRFLLALRAFVTTELHEVYAKLIYTIVIYLLCFIIQWHVPILPTLGPTTALRILVRR